MSEAGPEQIAVAPPRRHRWLRRELWFAVAAVVLVVAVALAFRHHAATHVAPGAPYGGIPVSVTPIPQPTPRPTPPAS